jgi:predicted DNA-binding transcriptional regulator AlpA
MIRVIPRRLSFVRIVADADDMRRSNQPQRPYWPRGLSVHDAAEYVGVSPNTFIIEMKAGQWPQPERRGRRIIWDRHEIDEFWDRRKLDILPPVSTSERAARWGGRSK